MVVASLFCAECEKSMDQDSSEQKVTTDSVLVTRAREGELDAFDELVCRYHSRLIVFLRYFSVSGTDVEAIAQEAFFKCFTHLDQFDTGRKFRNWLYTIARRMLPKSRPFEEIGVAELNQMIAPEQGPQSTLESLERVQSIWAKVRMVTDDEEFQLVWFRYAEQFSIKEIALVMQRSEAACKMRLSRLRKRLRPHLEPFVKEKPVRDLFDSDKRTA